MAATTMTLNEPIEVSCYAGHKNPERPRYFIFRSQRFEVVEVLSKWIEGSLRAGEQSKTYFRTKTEEGRIFELCHLDRESRWIVVRELEKKVGVKGENGGTLIEPQS